MSNLQHRQDKIKAHRANTPFREFLMEIASWYPLNLYRNNGFITTYPDTTRKGIIIKSKEYESGAREESSYNGNFYQNLESLYTINPRPNVRLFGTNENSDYTDGSYGTKNCYLSFGLGNGIENGLYSFFATLNCSNIMNSVYVTSNSSNIFDSSNIKSSYNIFYSSNIHNSNNIWFSSNLIGCSECIKCDGLINQQYHIENIQYSKEEYLAKKQTILQSKHLFQAWGKDTKSHINNINSYQIINCTGVNNSSNIENGYFSFDVKDSRNVILFEGGDQGSNNFYDGIDVGISSEHFYATCQAGTLSSHIYCMLFGGYKCHNLFYCINMNECSFCLGCIGLKNKSYCILNKQYTKEEWYQKVDEIFSQMESDGTLGQFFPATMNPFYFNDTAAYLIDPSFTKEEVTARGYLWRDEPIKVDIPEGAQTVTTDQLGEFEKMENGIRSIDESICKKVILDHEGNTYRIIPMELEFLRKHGLPLPRKHWLERMKENFKINN